MEQPALKLVVILPLLIGFGLVAPTRRRRIESPSAATPPSFVFSVAWTIFYVLLGVLLYRLLRQQAPTVWVKATVGVLVAHLIATFAWTPLYVSGRKRGALYDMVVVIATALTLQMMLINHDQLFVVLLAPYIAWLLFALHLNYDVVINH